MLIMKIVKVLKNMYFFVNNTTYNFNKRKYSKCVISVPPRHMGAKKREKLSPSIKVVSETFYSFSVIHCGVTDKQVKFHPLRGDRHAGKVPSIAG